MRPHRCRRGMVLVLLLWVLGILTILAVSVAAGIRQKIFLVARLDERSRMNYLLEAAVKKDSRLYPSGNGSLLFCIYTGGKDEFA